MRSEHRTSPRYSYIAATALQRAVECTQESSSRLREYQHRIKETVEELDGVVNTPENSIYPIQSTLLSAGIRSEVLVNALSKKVSLLVLLRHVLLEEMEASNVLDSMGL